MFGLVCTNREAPLSARRGMRGMSMAQQTQQTHKSQHPQHVLCLQGLGMLVHLADI